MTHTGVGPHGPPRRTRVLFARENGWIPRVIRADGELRLELGAGADANHDPRAFAVPVSEAHSR